MKKLFLALLTAFLTPTISACQDKAHSIMPIHTTFSDVKFCSLEKKEFRNIMDSGQEFAIEFYSPFCSHCKELEPQLEKYTKETNNLIYRFDLSVLTHEETEELTKLYPDVLPDSYVPAIRFVSNKHLTYEVENTKFESYRKLRQSLNGHFLTSRVNIVDNDLSYSSFVANYKSYVVCRYNLENKNSLAFVSNYLLSNEMYKKGMPVLLLNSAKFDSYQYFVITEEYNKIADSYDFVAIVKDSKIIKAANYFADGFDFNSFIS